MLGMPSLPPPPPPPFSFLFLSFCYGVIAVLFSAPGQEVVNRLAEREFLKSALTWNICQKCRMWREELTSPENSSSLTTKKEKRIKQKMASFHGSCLKQQSIHVPADLRFKGVWTTEATETRSFLALLGSLAIYWVREAILVFLREGGGEEGLDQGCKYHLNNYMFKLH